MSMSNRTDLMLKELFDEIEEVLKAPEALAELTAKNVNTSIALVAVQGLRAYLAGDRAQAADDLGTAAEEIRMRHEDSIARRERLS
jgi:hypothetical protein